MQIINALILSTIAGISTVVGGLIVFLKIKNIDKFISFCLSFSAIIMIGISIFELFPESITFLITKYKFNTILIYIIVLFIIGKSSITLLNRLISSSSNLYKIGILNMIILILHNFPEGITTFITSVHDINIGFKISIAIMFHNIPEGISIAAPIYIATRSRKKALFKVFISGLSEPLGALFAYIFLKNHINDYLISFLLLIVSIIMISLSIEKLLPEAYKYNSKRYIRIGVLLGIIILLISLFIL